MSTDFVSRFCRFFSHFIYDPDSPETFFRHANFLSGIPILQMLSHVLLLPKSVVQVTDSVTHTIIPPWYACRYSLLALLAHKMQPYFSLFKPCQPSFDVVINPGRRWKQLKGTAFFRSYIRLHIHLYREAPDRSQFRMDLVKRYMELYHRFFYWYHSDGRIYIPAVSLIFVATKTKKIFDFLLFQHKQKKATLSVLGSQGSLDDDIDPNAEASSLLSSFYDDDDNDTEFQQCRSDAILLLENARRMRELLSEQFSSPERVSLYSKIMAEGVGQGIYATQEKEAYAPLFQLFTEHDQSMQEFQEDEKWYDEDEEYSGTKTIVTKTKSLSMQQKLKELDSIEHQKITQSDFFPMRTNNKSRWCSPRLSMGSTVILNIKGLQLMLKIVQVLRSRDNPSDFFYIMRSPSDVSSSHYERILESLFFERLENGRASVIQYKESSVTQSSTTSDIFSYSLAKPTNFPLRYFQSRVSRNLSLQSFTDKISCPSFQKRHREFFSQLTSVVMEYTQTAGDITQRVGWATWVPTKFGDRWFAWQITTLLLLTNSVHDKIVRNIVTEMFQRFPSPLEICRNPPKFLDFLTSKAKAFSPIDSSFDLQVDSITKGPNFCYQKARYIVACSKQVVLLWCMQNVRECIYSFPELKRMYLDTSQSESLQKPLPHLWVDGCALSENTLFPDQYEHDFFSALPGVGLKMRHLCSEAIYKSIIGPAIDCENGRD